MTEKILPYNKELPQLDENVFIAQGAVLIGRVSIGTGSGIWYNSVVRGDVNYVQIGKNTNVQDGSLVHVSRFENCQTIIGNDITIGHHAVIHGCTIQDGAFIGMQSMIMDRAVISKYAMVGAGSLVPPDKVVPSGELWVGRPAKFVRKLTDDDLEHMATNTANYVRLAKEYLAEQAK